MTTDTRTPKEIAALMGKVYRPSSRKRSIGEPTAREEAAAKGWYIDPEFSPGNPHDWGSKCDCKGNKTTGLLQWCTCGCHGYGGSREKDADRS